MAPPVEHDIPELPNVIGTLAGRWHNTPWSSLALRFIDVAYALLLAIVVVCIVRLATRRLTSIPRGLQNGCEWIVESLEEFFSSVLGRAGRPYIPFLGTLFLYILLMNLMGLIPGLKSPTTNLNVNLALAIAVFLVVQITGIRALGFFGYLKHMTGNLGGAIGFLLAPLMLMMHVIEEIMKPVTLSIRLFGAITGDDTSLAVMVNMGLLGIPLQLMSLALGILLGTVQAVVFTLLSAVYIALMLPHESEPAHGA